MFVPSRFFLSSSAEKKRYDLHRNASDDPGYRRFLSRLFAPLHACLSPGSSGLDFGSGPEPVLARMFEQAGHAVTIFDRYYAPSPAAFEGRYDFITACEVAEHFHDPGPELDRLWSCLEPGGMLGVMTRPAPGPEDFPAWQYKNDLTHVCFFSPATFRWLAARWDAEVTFPDHDVALFRKRGDVHPGKSRSSCDESGLRDRKASSGCGPFFAGSFRNVRDARRALPVLFQDDHLVAVHKPAGLLVHRTGIDRRETEYALQRVRDQLGRRVYPLHRLDKATSGVLLFALDRETARRMTEAFTAGRISKSYLAVVRGFTDEAGRIDHPVPARKDRREGPLGDSRPKEAVTDYLRLATVELPHPVGRYATARYSLVRANPLTGRTHQIRRHMKHIFHPLIGDTTYGDGRQNEFFRTRFNCRRLLLHCRETAFSHPGTGREVRIRAPLEEDLIALFREFAWEAVSLD